VYQIDKKGYIQPVEGKTETDEPQSKKNVPLKLKIRSFKFEQNGNTKTESRQSRATGQNNYPWEKKSPSGKNQRACTPAGEKEGGLSPGETRRITSSTPGGETSRPLSGDNFPDRKNEGFFEEKKPKGVAV